MIDRRVALVCAGVGVVNRGFERLALDLFLQLDGEVELMLFKGGGVSGPNERAVRVPRRTDFHAGALGKQRALELELGLFAARVYPRLRHGYDVVHYFEPYLGNALAAFRRRAGGRFTLVLTDALFGLSRLSSSRADVVHVPTPGTRERLIGEGRPADEVVEIPMGIDTGIYASAPSKLEARRALGLPAAGRVLVDVAAVNRQKRIDFLIDEVARLDDDSILLLAGAAEEPRLLELARKRLGSRFHHAYLPPEQTPLLYAAGDVFVHAALEEGYGLAVIEAMAASLPVVVHRSPHFEWLVGDVRQLVDLTRPGALGERLATLPEDAGTRNCARVAEFSWDNLIPRYLQLYESLPKQR